MRLQNAISTMPIHGIFLTVAFKKPLMAAIHNAYVSYRAGMLLVLHCCTQMCSLLFSATSLGIQIS
jgi:hypothetical protein